MKKNMMQKPFFTTRSMTGTITAATYHISRGFTLIEIVIALVVLIVGLAGVIAVIPAGQRSAKDAAIVTRAALIGAEKMEEIKAYGYAAVVASPQPFPLSGTKDDIAWKVVISDVLQSDFSNMVALPVQHLQKIVITVTYRLNNKERKDQFHSFITEF